MGNRKNYTQQELLSQLDQMQVQIDEIRLYLHHAKESTTPSEHKNENTRIISEYDTGMSWQGKIIFILKHHNKAITSSDIVSFLNKYDSVFEYKRTELDKLKMLSTHLNRTVKKGVIKRFTKPGIRGYFYSVQN